MPEPATTERPERTRAARLLLEIQQEPLSGGAQVGALLQALRAAPSIEGLESALAELAGRSGDDELHARLIAPLLVQQGEAASDAVVMQAVRRGLDRATPADAICAALIDHLTEFATSGAEAFADEIRLRDHLPPQTLRALAWLVRRLHGGGSEITGAAMDRAIAAMPSDRTLLRAWFDDLQERLGLAPALARLSHLASQPGAAAALGAMHQRWSRYKAPAVALQPDQEADCRAVWDDHLRGRPGDADQWERVAKLEPGILRQAMLGQVTRQVPLLASHPHHLRLLRQAGLSAERLRAWSRGFLAVGSEAWRATLEGAGVASEASRQRLAEPEASTGWQDRAVAEGGITCPCPLDGEPRQAFDAVVIHGAAYYAFAGRETFYLICTGYSMRAYALWCPGRNLMLTFARGGDLEEGVLLGGGIGHLLRRIAANREAFLAARASTRPRRRVTVLIRSIRNFAHQIWNLYSGFERLAVAGLLPRIHAVVHYNDGFFGPFAEIYPELPPGMVREQGSTPIFDLGPFSTDDLVVPVGGYFMARNLRRRVRDAMARIPALPGAPDPAQASHPIVWLGIRVTDKGWIDQERGMAEMCRRILAAHPGATFVADAFTLPLGQAAPPSDWAQALERMHGVVEGIGRELGRPDRIVSLVGQTMREAILWAAASDAYVSPLGTSQHKVGWFAEHPGVIFAHPSYAVRPELAPGCWEAEWLPPPTIIPGIPDAQGGDSIAVRPPRPRMENLHLEPGVVADAVLALLARRGDVRTAPGQPPGDNKERR